MSSPFYKWLLRIRAFPEITKRLIHPTMAIELFVLSVLMSKHSEYNAVHMMIIFKTFPYIFSTLEGMEPTNFVWEILLGVSTIFSIWSIIIPVLLIRTMPMLLLWVLAVTMAISITSVLFMEEKDFVFPRPTPKKIFLSHSILASALVVGTKGLPVVMAVAMLCICIIIFKTFSERDPLKDICIVLLDAMVIIYAWPEVRAKVV